MPETSKPVGFSIPQWTTGSSSLMRTDGAGSVKRVSTNDDIRINDINDVRTFLEALSEHTHGYTDSIGSC